MKPSSFSLEIYKWDVTVSWSGGLFIFKTKALSTTSCLPSMERVSSVRVWFQNLIKRKNRVKMQMLPSEYWCKLLSREKNILYSVLTLRSSKCTENFRRSCKPGQKLENTKTEALSGCRNEEVQDMAMSRFKNKEKLHINTCISKSWIKLCSLHKNSIYLRNK